MTYLLSKVHVEQFDEWKAHFDAGDLFRTANGQRGFRVFQSVDDPNAVVVLLEFDSAEDARAFAGSEEWRRRVAKSGARGRHDVTILEQVDAETVDEAVV